MNNDESVQRGHAIRKEILRILSHSSISEALCALTRNHTVTVCDGLLSGDVTAAICEELGNDIGWQRECWLIDTDQQVRRVDLATFELSSAGQRFSFNDCLRQPAPTAFALRGFLSAAASSTATEVLENCIGQKLRACSTDIARYRRGDYLRRHCDNFGGRRVGFVWFFASGWKQGDGGELVVEDEFGRAQVIQPLGGRIVSLVLGEHSFHQVAQLTSSTWSRYSIAMHFGMS